MPVGRPTLWTDADYKRLLPRYSEGYARREIAKSFGRTGEAIFNAKSSSTIRARRVEFFERGHVDARDGAVDGSARAPISRTSAGNSR